MWFFFLLARESPFKTRFQFLFLVLICVLKDAVTTMVCEIHVQWLSGTLRPWFCICKFGLVSALVFLLHNKYFESVTFFF